MTPEPYRHRFPIRIHDVDAAGIVFFARYFVLMHDAYESFLADIGHSISDAIRAGDILIPVVESHCRYRRPMRHGETIEARLSVTVLKHTTYTVRVEFVGEDGVSRAVLTVRHVCVGQATMKPVPLPAAMHDALAGFLAPEPAGDAPHR